ncbi:unnamed protein product [[Candida] boidinii]|nr:unnamed protein product [[Candida] boidinii]
MAVLLEKDTLVNELVNTLVECKDGDRSLVLNKESSLTLSLLFPQVYIEAMSFVDGFLVLSTPGTGGINTDGRVIDSAGVIDKDGGSESANQEQRCGGDRLNQVNQLTLVRFHPMELCVVAGAVPAGGETAGEQTFSTTVNIPRRSVVCDVGECVLPAPAQPADPGVAP